MKNSTRPSTSKSSRKSQPCIPIGEEELLLRSLQLFLRGCKAYLKEYGKDHYFGHRLDSLLPGLRLFHEDLVASSEDFA